MRVSPLIYIGGYEHLKEVLQRQKKRREIGAPIDCKLLLSVGELSIRKNHRVVVEALQSLPNDYWYVIVGKGQLKDNLETIDTTGHLRLLGYRTDIIELLHSADLFVFPSLQEGLPVALMESMASGVKVIASNIRGNSDLTDSLVDINKAEAWRIEILKDRASYSLPKVCWKTSVDKQMRELYEDAEQER